MRKVILGFLIFAGCSKTKDSTSITVAESVSHLPVSGAEISLFKCDSNCPSGGPLLFHGVTDVNGMCELPSMTFNAATSMYVRKAQYHTFEVQFGAVPALYLTPIGYIQLRIHQVGGYPPGSDIQLWTKGEFGRYGSTRTFFTEDAVDTIITLDASGDEQNEIEYIVGNAGAPLIIGTLNAGAVPKFDTLKNVTLDY